MKKLLIVCLVTFLTIHFAFASVVNRSFQDTVFYNTSVNIDLDNDGTDDFLFFIDKLPSNDLYCKVQANGSNAVLDNSTYGYADAMDKDVSIESHWGNVGLLGTFTNAGQFNGQGNKYLGVKLVKSGMSYIGWIQLNLDQDRTRLIIINGAYNDHADEPMKAGQSIATGLSSAQLQKEFEITQSGKELHIVCNGQNISASSVRVFRIDGVSVFRKELSLGENILFLHSLNDGLYILSIESNRGKFARKVYLTQNN